MSLEVDSWEHGSAREPLVESLEIWTWVQAPNN